MVGIGAVPRKPVAIVHLGGVGGVSAEKEVTWSPVVPYCENSKKIFRQFGARRTLCRRGRRRAAAVRSDRSPAGFPSASDPAERGVADQERPKHVRGDA
jgi:hypothetical protein